MTLKLKRVLAGVGQTQAALARHLRLSDGLVAQMVNHDFWPKSIPTEALQERIHAFLRAHGADESTLKTVFEKLAEPRCSAALPAPHQPEANDPEDVHMLLRKQTLTREAKTHFRIPRDPFTDEMRGDADVFTSDDIRYVRAAMRQVAKHGGLLAVIAESGAGKSTLRHDLAEWINANDEPVTIIEPYVLGMEDTDNKGRMLRAADITGAVIRRVAPGTRLRASHQDRSEQMHDILRASAQVGRKHLLIIEEAHCLATPTLKHLKRFYEVQEGFKKLLAIILIGQTELEWKLSEHNPEVREVVQRCEFARLGPLGPALEPYLRHKFTRADADFDGIFAPGAVPAINELLRTSITRRVRGQSQAQSISLCYPLAVNNLVSGAMNQAVRIGAPKVTAELIAAAVRREE
ncbi:ExeA family protein [Thauera butanivorans]|uniref:ExeA family protein n=1 Tax=Thauera butanivorans TaxID=86174 RepID=UPI003AB4DB9A